MPSVPWMYSRRAPGVSGSCWSCLLTWPPQLHEYNLASSFICYFHWVGLHLNFPRVQWCEFVNIFSVFLQDRTDIGCLVFWPCPLYMEIINSWETITEVSPKLLAKLYLSLRQLYSMCLVALWLHLPLVNQGPSSSGWVDPSDTYLLSQLQLNIVI